MVQRRKNKYIIKESALLSSNSYLELDEIIFVKSPMELRIKEL